MLKLSNKHLIALAAGTVASVLAFLLVTPEAEATRFEPNAPVTLVAGPPRGAGTMARVDGRRRGCVDAIPDSLKQVWRLPLRGGVEMPAAVDQDGSVVVALTLAEVVQVSPSGVEQWRTKTGISTATVAPVILRDGTRLVLNALGEAWAINPNGSIRFRVDLGSLGRDPRVAPLPLENSTVVVAAGPNILILEPDGSIRAQTRAEESLVGSLIETPSGIVGTTDSGKVILWSPPLAPKILGTFRGSIRDGALLADDQTLLAVVDRRRLVAFNLLSGSTETRASLFGLEGPPSLSPNGVTFNTTYGGLLVGNATSGEILRVPLDPGATSQGIDDAGVLSALYTRSSPPILVDRRARVLFARADGRVGVVNTSGRVFVFDSGCDETTSIVAAPQNRFVLTCRAGALLMLGP